jgi:hypothetical protein
MYTSTPFLRACIRGPFLTSPLVPRGEICPQGGMLTPSFTTRGELSTFLEEWRVEQRISPLGSKFAPRGEVKNEPLVSKFVSSIFFSKTLSLVTLLRGF